MIKSTPKEASYEFTDDEIKIGLTIEIEDGTYTLWTEDRKLDFSFVNSEPAHSKRVIALMMAATEYAIQVLKQGNGWENVTDSIKATVKTEIEIGAIHKPEVAA